MSSTSVLERGGNWTIKRRFNDLPLDKKEELLKKIIEEAKKEIRVSEAWLEGSDTYQSRKTFKRVLVGALGAMAAGIGAILLGNQLDPSMVTTISGAVAFTIGSAGVTTGTLASPFFIDRDFRERKHTKIIREANERIKKAEKELKELNKGKKQGR